jgi:hypothetical protein
MVSLWIFKSMVFRWQPRNEFSFLTSTKTKPTDLVSAESHSTISENEKCQFNIYKILFVQNSNLDSPAFGKQEAKKVIYARVNTAPRAINHKLLKAK